MTQRRTLALALIALFPVVPALAAEPEGVVRVFVSQANPGGDWTGIFDTEIGLVSVTLEADSTTGLTVVFEQRYGKRVGVEAGIGFFDYDFDIRMLGMTESFGSAAALPIWVGLDLHAGGDRVDFYVGPLVHYTTWGDLEGPYGSASTEGEIGLGAVVGLDVPFRRSQPKARGLEGARRRAPSGWMFNAAVRYMDVAAGDDSLKIDVNPTFFEAGLGYRW